MEKLEKEGDVEVGVISFDLNNLKIVNDTYGHSKGDDIIRQAAELILSNFENCGVVGRMGGDEFIAILVNTSEEEVEERLEHFRSDVHIANARMKDYPLSIAFGYASSSEMETLNIEKIYQLADCRMYENKKEYKMQKKE
jgi:diguanylate cyclase (GGDEF)-like protein